MCFMIYTNVDVKRLKRDFPLNHEGYSTDDKWSGSFLGPQKTSKIPVIYNREGTLSLDEMNWSLCPSWAKEFPCKWSTYNARMTKEITDKSSDSKKEQRVYQTPTFKNAFNNSQFCLIPLTHAVESCYWGPDAGNILRFKRQDSEPFYVAGLWDEWVNESTGEIKKTATLLTHSPYKYLFDHGHDRSIILLNDRAKEELLLNPKKNKEENFQFILKNRVDQEWHHEIERPLKEGWQKKRPGEEELEKIKREIP